MDIHNLTRRQRKRVARDLLDAWDPAELLEWARRDGRIVETLLALLFEQDDLIRWRAVDALGRVAALLAAEDMESVRDLIRRLLWSMNDESGNLGWHSPEAIGEILVNVPALIDEFGVVLGSFLREEPFERGAHWAVARIARLRPDVYANRVDELTASLHEADPFIRGYAVLALGALGAESAVGEIAALRDDDAVVTLYDNQPGQLRETCVKDLARSVLESTGRAGETPAIADTPDVVAWSDPENMNEPDGSVSPAQAAQQLVDLLHRREKEFRSLMRITEHVNRGMTLEQVLDFLYQEMQQVIPYNRIGFSLIDEQRGVVTARWARSDRPMSLKRPYEAPLSGSTLEQIVETVKPRIINDLPAYLREKPQSESTKLIVQEGMRSSLTCPLIIHDKPVGFVFFSSVDKGTYSRVHVAFFQQIAGQLAMTLEKSRLYGELAEQKAAVEKQNAMMTAELDMARRVQRALIPQKVPDIDGLDVAFAYEPAIQVGGDIVDIIPLSRGRVLFFVADAMGHGVQAALVMSVVKAALHAAVEPDPSPSSVLASVNKVIVRLFEDHLVTAACCLLDPDGAQGELALAGHAGPLRFRAATEDVVSEGDAALPLGIQDDIEFGTVRIALDPGDALVFSTDGIVEAFDPSGNQYGNDRFKNQVLHHSRSSAAELCASIRHDLDLHCKGCVRKDDVTLLVVKFDGMEAETGKA